MAAKKTGFQERMTDTFGVKPDGTPWQVKDFVWELDANGKLVMKSKKDA